MKAVFAVFVFVALATAASAEAPVTLSAARYKKHVRDSVPGLPFILKPRPVTHQLDVRRINRTHNVGDNPDAEAGILAEEAELQTGFIAPEVERAALAANYAFPGVSKPQSAGLLRAAVPGFCGAAA